MRVVSAGDRAYLSIIRYNEARTRYLGYSPTFWDLEGNLGFGRVWSPPVVKKERCLSKPKYIRRAFYYKEPFVWIDADAVLHGEIDEVFDEEFDIGITARDNEGWNLNAGVLFFWPTKRARHFVDDWIREIDTEGYGPTDQTYLRCLLYTRYGLARKKMRKYFTQERIVRLRGGLRVKCLPHRYNTIYTSGLDPFPTDMKIIHFQGYKGRSARFYKYLAHHVKERV